jgi:hypothetical protein
LQRGVWGDFINQSAFHNVIPTAFLSGNPESFIVFADNANLKWQFKNALNLY